MKKKVMLSRLILRKMKFFVTTIKESHNRVSWWPAAFNERVSNRIFLPPRAVGAECIDGKKEVVEEKEFVPVGQAPRVCIVAAYDSGVSWRALETLSFWPDLVGPEWFSKYD